MSAKSVVFIGAALLISCLTAIAAPAHDRSLESPSDQKKIREQIKELWTHLRPKDRRLLLSEIKKQQKPSTAQSASGVAAKATISARTKKPPSKDASQATNDLLFFLDRNKKGSDYQKARCPGLNFIVRQDWKDMGFDACPSPVDTATGAQLSYANNREAKNEVWTTHGTAALLFNHTVPNKPDEWDLYHQSYGAYVSVNKLTNSASSQSKSDLDTVAFGGVAIFALSSPGDVGLTQWFRLRAGEVQDNVKKTTATNITAEWSPAYSPWYIHFPLPPVYGITVRFDPEIEAEYDKATGSNQVLLFNNKADALRVGPMLALNIQSPPEGPNLVSRWNATVSYHWEYEAYSAKTFGLFEAAITYNLDQFGFIGLTASYDQGRDDDTGAPTNLFKIGLSGKI